MLWVVGKISPDYHNYFTAKQIAYGLFVDTKRPSKIPSNIPVIPINFSSADSVISSLRNISFAPEVEGIMIAGYEHYVVPAAILAQHFGVPGPTLESARSATDKAIMRQCFFDYAPHITPSFSVITSWEDVERFMSTHNYPVVLKPTNLMKSLYVSKSASISELKQHYQKMVKELPGYYHNLSVPLEPAIVIEEFMAGSMHTVAGFTGADGLPILVEPIADCKTAQDIDVDDSYLFSRSLPSILSAEQQEEMRDVAAAGMQALGLSNSPVHAELILTKEGPKIIEIGARIGGYRPRMYEYAFGIDLYQAAVAIALGKTPELKVRRHSNCTVIELFPEKIGALSRIQSIDELQALPSLQYMGTKYAYGAKVGTASAGFRAALVVFLGHENKLQLAKDLEFIRDNVKIVIT